MAYGSDLVHIAMKRSAPSRSPSKRESKQESTDGSLRPIAEGRINFGVGPSWYVGNQDTVLSLVIGIVGGVGSAEDRLIQRRRKEDATEHAIQLALPLAAKNKKRKLSF